MQTSRSQSVRFQLLDPLRGLAALWVFTFHYEWSEPTRLALPSVIRVFRMGHLGVSMFFVISGYCLMASIRVALRNRESVRSFLTRRFLRIYPPYWFSILVVAAVPFIIEGLSAIHTGAFVRPTADGNINFGYLQYGVFDWVRVLTLTQVFAPTPGATDLQVKFTTINAVYWTLAIEFQFYIVMAVALALRSRWFPWLAAVTAAGLVTWYASLLMVSGIFLPYWPMFAVGIALYLVLERGVSLENLVGRSRVIIAALATAVLLGAALVLMAGGYHPDTLVLAAFFGFLLWFIHALDETYSAALKSYRARSRWLLGGWKVLGLMSYSLYLLHGRLQFLAAQAVRQLLSPGIFVDVLTIALTCAMIYVFYRVCEKPFVRVKVKSTTKIPQPAEAGLAHDLLSFPPESPRD